MLFIQLKNTSQVGCFDGLVLKMNLLERVDYGWHLVNFLTEFIFKIGSRGEYTSVLSLKCSAVQRRIGEPQINFDLQLNKHNIILKTTNVMSLLPSILLTLMKIS